MKSYIQKAKLKKFIIYEQSTIKDTINEISKSGKKCLIVCTKENYLLGTISDGDIRKSLLKNNNLNLKIKNIYNKKPISIKNNQNNPEKINKIFVQKKLDLIPIVDSKNKLQDIIFWDSFFSNDKNKKIKNNELIIIMAGGVGSRMRPYTNILPKPLLSFDGKAMIDIVFENFQKNNFNKFLVSLNYKANLLKLYLNEKKDKNIKTILEQKALGTVGILSKIKNGLTNNFILTNCDTLLNYDYSKILKYHNENKNIITIVYVKKKYEVPYGNFNIDKSSNILSIQEKPKLNLNVNIGFYVFNKRILTVIPKNKYLDFDELLTIALEHKLKVKSYQVSDYLWTDLAKIK